MKATELRIGNLVGFVRPENTDEITGIFNGDNGEYLIKTKFLSGIPIGDYQPIPLTEEWLIKAGFSKINLEFANRFVLCGICIYETFNMKHEREGFHADVHVLVNLEHVHQLQNLYFALTGKELTFKTKVE